MKTKGGKVNLGKSYRTPAIMLTKFHYTAPSLVTILCVHTLLLKYSQYLNEEISALVSVICKFFTIVSHNYNHSHSPELLPSSQYIHIYII